MGEVVRPLSYADMIKRGISIKVIKEKYNAFSYCPNDILDTIETDIRYEGYIKKELEQIERTNKLKVKRLPCNTDYIKIEGLRMEARQKLNEVQPENLDQASRIPGVNPADIAVLMVWLKGKNERN